MVKSETRQDAKILLRNPSPRLFGKKFRDSKKVKTNHAKTRLKDLSKMLPIFRDAAKIFPRARFFEVPFTAPASVIILVQTLLTRGGCCNHDFFDIYTTQNSKVTFFVFTEN